MNWLNRFLLANWSWLMDGMLLFMALIIGIQVGESHVHKEWNAEKSKNEQLAAKLEQHVTDVKLMQNQINQEISNDFSKKSKLLADRLLSPGGVGLCNSAAGNNRDLSTVPKGPLGANDSSPDTLPSPRGSQMSSTCEMLTKDAAQTTLMLQELQGWVTRQGHFSDVAVEKPSVK